MVKRVRCTRENWKSNAERSGTTGSKDVWLVGVNRPSTGAILSVLYERIYRFISNEKNVEVVWDEAVGILGSMSLMSPLNSIIWKEKNCELKYQWVMLNFKANTDYVRITHCVRRWRKKYSQVGNLTIGARLSTIVEPCCTWVTSGQNYAERSWHL